MNPESGTDPAIIRRGLVKVRGRRWILWTTILIYMPGMMIGLYLQASSGTMGKLFAGWVGLLCIAVGMATVVLCPACGKPFHTNGPTFLPVRRCVHCGLPLHADKLA
jgi:uncharacterized membrane protein YhdT